MNKIVRIFRSLLTNTRGEQMVNTLVLVAIGVTLVLAAAKVLGTAYGTKAGTQATQITGL